MLPEIEGIASLRNRIQPDSTEVAMKLMLIPALVLLLAACSSGSKNQEGAADHSASTPHPAAKTATATTPAATLADGAEMVLTGTSGCGHCNFHIGDSCAMGLQTADGKIFILEGPSVGEGTQIWDDRMASKPLKVKGKVSERNGQAYMMVASVESN